MRQYNEEFTDHEFGTVIPVDEWLDPQYQKCNDWGSGYWMKDGFVSRDEVFGTPPEDATHVVWYDK